MKSISCTDPSAVVQPLIAISNEGKDEHDGGVVRRGVSITFHHSLLKSHDARHDLRAASNPTDADWLPSQVVDRLVRGGLLICASDDRP